MQGLKNNVPYQFNSQNKNTALIDEIHFVYKENHPFENLKNVNLHFIILEHLAVAETFPYLQSQKNIFFHYINHKQRNNKTEPFTMYSEETKVYINELYENLSSMDPIRRYSTIISFQQHSIDLKNALNSSIMKQVKTVKAAQAFSNYITPQDEICTAELKKTAEKMLSFICSDSKKQDFLKEYKQIYKVHLQWCQNIKEKYYNNILN